MVFELVRFVMTEDSRHSSGKKMELICLGK